MIGVLIFPSFQLLDAAGPISTFEIAMRYSCGAPAVRAIAIEPGPVRSNVTHIASRGQIRTGQTRTVTR